MYDEQEMMLRIDELPDRSNEELPNKKWLGVATSRYIGSYENTLRF
jgi:hypothetical protein